ncbi:hypothetical protein ACWCQK_22425 [Streptomyces sp. NPDC002306]
MPAPVPRVVRRSSVASADAGVNGGTRVDGGPEIRLSTGLAPAQPLPAVSGHAHT